MIYQRHCPGCFALKSGLAICPQCGYDEGAPRPAVYLPHGAHVAGQYRIGRVLGRPGGFGITYLAWDVHLQQRVAIKEYLPRRLAARAADGAAVAPLDPANAAEFDRGLEHFLGEARLMARFDHPHIMRVRNFFRANGTAYLVMDYYEGVSLGDYLAGLPAHRVAPEGAVRLLAPILDGVDFMHQRGIVHRDIKPGNIYLTASGRPILLDFGAAQAGNDSGEGELVLSEGYAPLEQYQRGADQGAWTDVYSLAATCYRMLAGKPPPAPLDRMGDDPLRAPLGLGAGAFEEALRKGLALRAADRYASAHELRDALLTALSIEEHSVDAPPVYTAPVSETQTTRLRAPDEPTMVRAAALVPGRREFTWGQVLMICAAIVIGAGIIALAL